MFYSRYSSPNTQHNNVNNNVVFIPYTDSEIEALVAGYLEVADDRAFNRRYFIKDGKKWIHNLGKLRNKLNSEYGRYICDEELSASAPEGFGYDVENYYSRHPSFGIAKTEAFRTLLDKVRIH